MADEKERFELLYRQHFRAVLRYVLGRLEPGRAQDVAAETFLIAWRRLDDVPSEPAAWLFGVARKVIADQLRAEGRRSSLALRVAISHSRYDGPADPAELLADRDCALTALARLGEFDRELLKLIAWDGLSAAEAAEVLGVSRLNFAVRLHRARRRLAAELALADAMSDGGSEVSRSTRPARPQPEPPGVVPLLPATTAHLAGRHADGRSN